MHRYDASSYYELIYLLSINNFRRHNSIVKTIIPYINKYPPACSPSLTLKPFAALTIC